MPEETRTIERDCTDCGKTIEVTVYEDDSYDGGQYFGEVSVPAEASDGEYEKTGEWKGHDVVEWTGDEETFEYWECDDCFVSPQPD
jgi:NADPH-dependent 2,4-dienoyl-CoA reductase/sulfur reductase-like enzyme